jgi:hypothetical protein
LHQQTTAQQLHSLSLSLSGEEEVEVIIKRTSHFEGGKEKKEKTPDTQTDIRRETTVAGHISLSSSSSSPFRVVSCGSKGRGGRIHPTS